MGAPYNKYIQLLRESKKKRRQLACFVTALSVFVSGNVFWQLRGIGTAMVDENLPTADDSGCDLTATPLNASELETQDVWEATLPPLTGIAGENLARIAESQLGYSESSINFVHAEDGETHNGYTRYGAWYGNPYGDWNTMFTYFCMNYAGVKSEDIPYGSGCWAWSLELDKDGLIVPVTRGSPARGDILLIDSDLDGKADRSCIVTEVSEDELPEISAVEGDVDGSVALTSYLLDDEHLLGIVSLADIVPEPPILPVEPAEVDFIAESESGIRVEAHADSSAFPSDTEMFVFDISRDEAIRTAAGSLGTDTENVDAVAVDITFTAPDGTELEPAEGSQVSVSIVLPEKQSLAGESFSLLHVSDDGDVQEVENAIVSPDGADFVAEEFSVYVITSDNTPIPLDHLTVINGQYVNNSREKPYVVYVGDPFEVFMNGDADIYVFEGGDYLTSNLANETYSISYDGTTISGKHRKYTPNTTGKCRISNGTDSLYIDIKTKESADIYVRTKLEDKQIDRVREYLKGYNLINDNGFVPNGPGKNVDADTPRPYSLRCGDEFEIYLTGISSFTVNNYDLSWDSGSPWCCHLTETQQQKLEMISCENKYDAGITALRFKAKENIGDSLVEIKFTQFDKSMWVRVFPPTEKFTHADMEIADGGKYTITEISYDELGKKITTVREFNALVNYVNFAKVYGSGTEPLSTFKSDLDSSKSDYEMKGEEGGTQYELTSAYKCQWKSDKHYYAKDVEHVLFDINIELRPTAVYTIDENNTVTLQESFTPEQGIANHSFINNVQYDFGKQEIIDAMNKCPMLNGLDFTVKAKGAVVKLKAIKELDGEKPNADQFEFELVNSDGEVVSTAKNDANGNVVFLDQVFSEPGTYNYTVREIVPANSTDYIYDTTPKPITVTISEVEINGTKVLTAKISEIPELKNYTPYTLPSTGGTGELPYIIFGTAMLAGAFTLLFIRRKKAAAR